MRQTVNNDHEHGKPSVAHVQTAMGVVGSRSGAVSSLSWLSTDESTSYFACANQREA